MSFSRPDSLTQISEHLPMSTMDNAYQSGGAGAFSDLQSFTKVLAMVLRHGVGTNDVRILKESTVREMFEDHVSPLPGLNNPIPSTIPELSPHIPGDPRSVSLLLDVG